MRYSAWCPLLCDKTARIESAFLCCSQSWETQLSNRCCFASPSVRNLHSHFLQGRALYGPMPVKTETFRELRGLLVHTFSWGNSYGPIIGPYLFLGKFVWTNGPESSSKVSPYTGIGPWMALPSKINFIHFPCLLLDDYHCTPKDYRINPKTISVR